MTFSRSSATPWARAKPSAALVGAPLASKAAFLGGPVTVTVWRSWRSARPLDRDGEPPRRRVDAQGSVREARLRQEARRSSSSAAQHRRELRRRQFLGPDLEQEGVAHARPSERVAQRLALAQVAFGHLARDGAQPAQIGRALGDADRAPGVEHIEQVRALQAVVVGGQDQLVAEQAPRLPLVGLEEAGRARPVSATSKLNRENSTSVCWWTCPYVTPGAQARS